MKLSKYITFSVQSRHLQTLDSGDSIWSWKNIAILRINPGSISYYLLIPASYKQMLHIFGILKPYAIDWSRENCLFPLLRGSKWLYNSSIFRSIQEIPSSNSYPRETYSDPKVT